MEKVLYERFGIRSDLYHTWEYEQYVRLAAPALAAAHAMGAADKGPAIILAHEFMGMPTALLAIATGDRAFRTVFYAHEVATMRRIVEGHPGHDTMFYNVLAQAMAKGKFVEDVFGLQAPFFKHSLVSAARFCDAILCVGDHTLSEMKFMGADFADKNLRLAYNKQWCDRPEVKRKLEQTLSRLAGRDLRIEFAVVPGGETVTPAERPQPAQSRMKKRREIEKHPLIRETQDLFDCEVVRVDEKRTTP